MLIECLRIFIDLEELDQPNIRILDSATVVFLPPFFQVSRMLPRQGLVAYVLKKLRKDLNF